MEEGSEVLRERRYMTWRHYTAKLLSAIPTHDGGSASPGPSYDAVHRTLMPTPSDGLSETQVLPVPISSLNLVLHPAKLTLGIPRIQRAGFSGPSFGHTWCVRLPRFMWRVPMFLGVHWRSGTRIGD